MAVFVTTFGGAGTLASRLTVELAFTATSRSLYP